jgi:hypothetical protein
VEGHPIDEAGQNLSRAACSWRLGHHAIMRISVPGGYRNETDDETSSTGLVVGSTGRFAFSAIKTNPTESLRCEHLTDRSDSNHESYGTGETDCALSKVDTCNWAY